MPWEEPNSQMLVSTMATLWHGLPCPHVPSRRATARPVPKAPAFFDEFKLFTLAQMPFSFTPNGYHGGFTSTVAKSAGVTVSIFTLTPLP